MRKLLFMALVAAMVAALFAPAALAQEESGSVGAELAQVDDDDGAMDDDDGATATATATATASPAPLPKTGGPSLVLALFAGLFLVGSGVLSLSVLRRQ